jgi:hypothetical protein
MVLCCAEARKSPGSKTGASEQRYQAMAGDAQRLKLLVEAISSRIAER